MSASLSSMKRRAIVAGALLLAAGLTVPAQGAPPAGAQIGNQASANYTDTSGTPQTATSNVVLTTVLAVYGVDVEQALSQNAVPASTSSFPVSVENTGNDSDSYTLSVVDPGTGTFTCASVGIFVDADSNGAPDNAIDLNGTVVGPQAAGTTTNYVATCQVPGGATAGQTAAITITATSSGNGTVSDSVVDTTTVTGNAVITVTKSMSASSGATGSGPHTITLSYTNNGNNTAADVTLTDVLDGAFVYVNGSASWSDDPGLTPTEGSDGFEGTAPNRIDYQVSPIPPAAGPYTMTAIIEQVAPGQSGTLSFDVTVSATATPSTVSNVASLSYDDDNNGATPDATGTSNTVNFTIDPTPGVTITASGPIASATPGSTISFTNTVTNTGDAPDIFDIDINTAAATYPAGTGFFLFQSDGVSPLLNSGGNASLPDTGTLAPGATYDVILQVILPGGVPGAAGPYSVDKSAISSLNAAVSDTATDTLTTIVAATMDLTNVGDPNLVGVPDGTGAGPEATAVAVPSGDPGTTVSFVLVANNPSATPDNYNLTAPVLPAGWTVVFRNGGGSAITNTGSVAAGGSVSLTAEVTIPAGWVGTDPGAATPYEAVQFNATSPTSGASDTILDGVFVNTLRAIDLTPNNTGQVVAGGSVVYAHTLSNNGNVTEPTGTITLTTAESDGAWGSALFIDNNGDGLLDAGDTPITGPGDIPSLAPGATAALLVRVTAPPGATTSNTTTVTATPSTTINGVAAPAAAQATDTTSIVSGNLTLLKEQALDAACDGTADAPGFGVGGISAAPNQCMLYRITATNSGVVDITTLVISDATPANTTMGIATSLTPAASGNVTEPALGAAGTVSVDVGAVGPLAPASSIIVEFGVRIDP